MQYNRVAEQVMKEMGILVVDLYGISVEAQFWGNIYVDHVHVTKELSRMHAIAIIEKLVFLGFL